MNMYLEGELTCETESKKSIIEMLNELRRMKNGEEICAMCNDEELTYERLFDESYRISEAMKEEKCVGISMDLSFELLIVICGLMRKGIPYVPLERNLPDERLSYLIDDSQMSIIITKDQFNESLFLQKQIKYVLFHQLINEVIQ